MNREEIFQKIVVLIKKIADNANLEINEDTQFSSIENWDSLNTVDLEMEVENTFSISFETGEFQEYKDVSTLINAIANKI